MGFLQSVFILLTTTEVIVRGFVSAYGAPSHFLRYIFGCIPADTQIGRSLRVVDLSMLTIQLTLVTCSTSAYAGTRTPDWEYLMSRRLHYLVCHTSLPILALVFGQMLN